MSNQLLGNFQNLQLMNAQISDGVEQTSSHACPESKPPTHKQRSTPMKLDPPTQNPRALQFYGFPVNREWLKAVGRRKMKPEYRPFADDLCMSAYALQLFRYYTRIDALTYKYVRNPGDAPPDCVTSGNEVLIVSVCNNLRDGFRNRPPQRNVDRLQEILKAGPPRWWEDAEWDAYVKPK
ncbi:hypothetical protein BU15DRAFT_65690 [Melanogaster broomeanus]|nr:hypothetical protein BU15DRAFT_65690 [Melanogaster broomeanus]